MLLGVVGSSVSVNAVLEEAGKNTLPIECLPLPYSRYTETSDIVRRHQSAVDAFLFSGTTPYHYALQHVNPEVPWEYLPRSAAFLFCAMLKAVYPGEKDIHRISVDSYGEPLLHAAYAEIGLSPEQVRIFAHPFQPMSADYIERLAAFHKTNIEDGSASFCLTGLQSVYDLLVAGNIPVTKAFATSEVILQQLQKLFIGHGTVVGKEHRTAVLSLQIKLARERSLYGKSDLPFFLSATKAMGLIYDFAQRMNAAVELSANESCRLYLTESDIEAATEGYTRLDLLHQIRQVEDILCISIGIGLGNFLADAKYHAELGKERALKFPRSSLVIVRDNHEIVGPVFEGAPAKEEPLVDRSLNLIAQKTGISPKKILQIQEALRSQGIDTATPAEIATLCKISITRMNRLLVQLEKGGYVKIVGKHAHPHQGRPSRLIQFLF